MKQYRTIKTTDLKADFIDGKYGASNLIDEKQEYIVCNLCQKEKNNNRFFLSVKLEDIDICPDCQTAEEKEYVIDAFKTSVDQTFADAISLTRQYRQIIDRVKTMLSEITNYPYPDVTWPEINKKQQAISWLKKALMELENINNPPF